MAGRTGMEGRVVARRALGDMLAEAVQPGFAGSAGAVEAACTVAAVHTMAASTCISTIFYVEAMLLTTTTTRPYF